ncbi:MAG TPA: chromosome segregation protein SMC [Armatimonadota bacterium]|jgi:chromosome segregation protein
MFLKRLDLFGFKTFAERTEVEFPVGVTAVVGPNGSGKSNISDSILWVLGESNVRHLRGDRAQDVIFAGTSTRKPLGMAEASLTFDNPHGRLGGMPDPEVTVTRRVYRNGEGEYFINRAPCRLKDIHELFLDTGIGRDAYNMVGQSDIDAILSARPEERRQLFEEAAGIKKYRIRKNEALRKLESTSNNLVRVTDILAEIERNAGPLEKAAAVAREFRGLDTRRKELETLVFAFDAERLSNDLITLRDDADLLTEEADAGRAARAEAEAEEAASRLRLTELERDVEAARTRLEEVRGERTRRDAERSLLTQRRHDAVRRDTELAEMLVTLQSRLDAAIREREDSAALAVAIEEQSTALGGKLSQARAEFEAERAVLHQAVERLQTLRAEESRLQTAIAARAGEARAARAEAERGAPLLARLAERKAALIADVANAETQIVEAAERTAELKRAQEELGAAKLAAEERSRSLEADIAQMERGLADTKRDIASVSARRRALAEMAESHEGFFAGVRAVLDAAKEQRLQGRFDAVADVIHVPAGLETAIETALGSQLQDIICNTDTDAKEAIALLKQGNAGRATFLPLDLLSPQPRVPMREAPEGGSPGSGPVLGWAADLVTYDRRFQPAIEMLLGRILVVDDLDTAVSLVRRDRLPIRVVSLDGEIVSGGGSITGGRGKGGQSHLLARKREMSDLGLEMKRLEADVLEREESVAALKAEREAAIQAGRDAAGALNENRMQSAETARKKQYAETESHRFAREILGVDAETRSAADRAAQLAQQADALEAASAGARADLAPVTAEIASLQVAEAGPDEARRQELVALEVESASLRERHNAAVATASRAEQTAKSTRDELASRTEQRDAARKLAGESTTVEESLADMLVALDASIAEALRNLDQHRTARDAVLQQSATHREWAHAAEERTMDAVEKLRKLEYRIAGLTNEREHILVRLKEILLPEGGDGESERAADRERLPDDEAEDSDLKTPVSEEEAEVLLAMVEFPVDFSRHTAVVELNRLRRQIADLGLVNPAAEEEFEKTSGRQIFLTTQRDDLVNAEETLRRAIREIDESTKTVFIETFEKVQIEFGVVFHRLFGGGITRLALTDPDDVLETGIEIIVQPPGKKLQNLQLLSGGERALTAAALLFAFLKVKPSPFVVLDEVDAPLDEANVGRFAVVLKEFSENSQFIVITHNRGTMEAAHALYGVTMQEPGISRLVSLRLEDRHVPTQPELITA